MALYYDLPIYKDSYELVLKLFQYTKEFPKECKYTLADKMRHDTLLLVCSMYQANKSERKRQPLDVLFNELNFPHLLVFINGIQYVKNTEIFFGDYVILSGKNIWFVFHSKI